MKSRLFAALRPNLTESSDGANISEQSPSTARSGKFFFCCKRNIFYRKVWDMVEERALQLAPPPGHHLKIFSISKLPIGNFTCCTFNNWPIYAPLQPHSKLKPSSWTPTPWPRAPRPQPSAPPIAPSQRQLFISTPPPAHQGSLSPFTGEDALDPLMQLQQNLAALNQATKNSLKRKHWTTCVPGEPGH